MIKNISKERVDYMFVNIIYVEVPDVCVTGMGASITVPSAVYSDTCRRRYSFACDSGSRHDNLWARAHCFAFLTLGSICIARSPAKTENCAGVKPRGELCTQ